MKILHFVLGKVNKDRATGVNQVVSGLCKYLQINGVSVRVIGVSESVDFEGQTIERDGFQVRVFSNWNPLFKSVLNEYIEWADIVHLHGAYIYSNMRIAKKCIKKKKPYVITLHNGLSPFLESRKSSLRKKFFRKLYLESALKSAALIHALTEEESTEISSLVEFKRMVCIPNGVDLDDFPLAQYKPKSADCVNVGYLGRLSSEKNIESLCRAVQEIKNINIKLVFAGPINNYAENIKSIYKDVNIEFVGPVYERAKIQFFSEIDIFVIPSLSEGFSIAAAECLASGPPLLISRTSKMSYFFGKNAFYMCEPTYFSIKNNLLKMIADKNSWDLVVENARQLVSIELNWNSIAKKLIESYQELVK